IHDWTQAGAMFDGGPRKLSVVAGVWLGVLVGGAAEARETVLQVTDATGAGVEQSTVVANNVGGRELLTYVWISSQVPADEGPSQCACATIEIDRLTGPRVVVPRTIVTHNQGALGRPCEHPKLASDGAGHTLLVYASD